MSALGGLGRRMNPLATRGAPARDRFKLAGEYYKTVGE